MILFHLTKLKQFVLDKGLKLVEGTEALKTAIENIKKEFRFILIDCPPSLNILTVNALAVSDSVIIPTQCEYYALEGLTALLETIDKIKISVVGAAGKMGCKIMYDPRNNLAQDVSFELEKHFGKNVLKTNTIDNAVISEYKDLQ